MPRVGQQWYRDTAIAERYDDARFTRGGSLVDRREKQLLLSLVEPQGKRILDIATGTGRFAELLQEHGADVVGLDASSEMLSPGGAQYVVGDARALPFADDAFDTSISMRFLHLLRSHEVSSFIREVARVTRDHFVFETLHPCSLRILYQWMLPQRSHLYSNSFLKQLCDGMPVVRDIQHVQAFLVPYGLYQLMPLELAEAVSSIDTRVLERYPWMASTVYWSLTFK